MSSLLVPPDYRPTDDEPFMSSVMREYFRLKLLRWQADLLRESNETLASLQGDGGMQEPDLADRASAETDRALELRTRDRERKLLSKIEAALQRIEDGSYGYCEHTGDPIGVKRLEARPIATLSLEAQERHERLERTQRDD
jgi:DnaK suppressor protein